jgi:hypothetical protein
MLRECAEHPDPLSERGQGQLHEQAIELGNARASVFDLVEIRGDGRCRGELDEGLEEVEGVIMAALG